MFKYFSVAVDWLHDHLWVPITNHNPVAIGVIVLLLVLFGVWLG